MWKSELCCNSPANGELSLAESLLSQEEMCYPQMWNRVVWSHCWRLGHTLFFDFKQYLNPLVPVAFQPELCPLWIGEGLGCLFMTQPRLETTWTCPCNAEPELQSPAQQHDYISLCFVFRLKVILALQLELAHVWSALEQMCGCLGRWGEYLPIKRSTFGGSMLSPPAQQGTRFILERPSHISDLEAELRRWTLLSTAEPVLFFWQITQDPLPHFCAYFFIFRFKHKGDLFTSVTWYFDLRF